MPADPPRSEQLGKLGAEYRQSLIEAMAAQYGNRPSDGQPLSHDQELELWLAPTSPAAIEAYKQGATHEEATAANRMWAAELKRQQEAAVAQGMTPAEIDQAGLSDEKIFQACRQHAWSRGKANSGGDPKQEVVFHQRMAEKARSRQATPVEAVPEGVP